MYMISLSRAYKNIWEQDNVCPDLPKILGSSSQIHIPFLGTNAHRGCALADVWKRTSAGTPSWPPIWRGSSTAPPAKSGNDISKWSRPSFKPVSGQKNSTDGCVIWLQTKRSPEWRVDRFREASCVPLQASNCIKDSGPCFLLMEPFPAIKPSHLEHIAGRVRGSFQWWLTWGRGVFVQYCP